MAEALSDRDTVIREPIIAVYEGKDIVPDDVTDEEGDAQNAIRDASNIKHAA